VKLTLERLLEEVGESGRTQPEPRPAPDEPPESDPISGTEAMATLREVFPDDGIVVVETPSSTAALRNQLRLSRPGSYFFAAGGGLGFGLAAAVGVQLAQPDRPVVCVIGEGSVQYAVSAFWSAVAYDVPLTFLVLRNSEYAILKWFATFEQVEGAPGLDLPRLDTAEIADGYGVNSHRVEGSEQLGGALREAFASDRPELVEVGVAPGMWLA
jgi:benzoylformate decarboxylase